MQSSKFSVYPDHVIKAVSVVNENINFIVRNFDTLSQFSENASTSDCLEAASNSLKEQFAVNALTLDNLKERANRLFGIILKAKSSTDKFMPNSIQIALAKSCDPLFCFILRESSIYNYCLILYPPRSFLKDTLFDVMSTDPKNALEYEDQATRAHAVVESLSREGPVTLYLLDGHGRMLLSILYQFILAGLDPDEKTFPGDCNNRLRITVCDIDPDVDSYHKLMFPKSINTVEKNILEIEPSQNDVVYLNFCSLQSNYENILKFIWVAAGRGCHVIISFIVKIGQGKNDDISTFSKKISMLGFINLLLDRTLFNSHIVSIRPENSLQFTSVDSHWRCAGVKKGMHSDTFLTLKILPMSALQTGQLQDTVALLHLKDTRVLAKEGNKYYVMPSPLRSPASLSQLKRDLFMVVDNKSSTKSSTSTTNDDNFLHVKAFKVQANGHVQVTSETKKMIDKRNVELCWDPDRYISVSGPPSPKQAHNISLQDETTRKHQCVDMNGIISHRNCFVKRLRRPPSFHSESPSIFVDAAVTANGDLFVLDNHKSRLFYFDQQGSWWDSNIEELRNPHGMAISSNNNKLYIANTMRSCVSVINTEVDKRLICKEWECLDTADNKLQPYKIAISPDDLIFVVYRDSDPAGLVQVFDSDGNYIRHFCVEVQWPNDSNWCGGLVVRENSIIICNNNDAKVQVVDKEGNFIQDWEWEGISHTKMAGIGLFPCSPSNEIYIVDSNFQNINVFNESGTFLRGWGMRTDGSVDSVISGILVTKSGHVYVLLCQSICMYNP